MKRRLIAPTAIALAVAAGVSGGVMPATASASGGALTVWLMTGDSVPAVYNSVNAAFQKEYPGWTVNVEIQQWSGISAKVISALAGSTPPDVMELGNTDVAEFAASGGLLNLSSDKSQFQNSSDWLTGLEGPAEYQGGLYAVPELAGDRVVVYNKAMFAAAGITHTPTSLSELLGDGAVLKNVFKNRADFSAFYLPGEEWYAAMPFVWAEGGQIAVEKGGKWYGDLESRQSLIGLQEYQAFQNFMSTPASQDVNEANPSDSQIFASGKAAMYIDGTWTLGTDVSDNKAMTGNIGTFALPGVTAGSQAPVFLGGSDLGIAKNSPNQAEALAWVKLYAGTANQLLQASKIGFIPNASNLVSQVKVSGNIATYFKAASVSQFTPPVPGWATVEADNVMQDLFAQVAEGKVPVSTIAKVYDQKLDNLLNAQ
ncbi:MAG TPA: extracellular solute-binding protein [Acidimicrobiales bacterium]|nr:extracellular solute-binding protein [Acidimicrobiales bacterium]